MNTIKLPCFGIVIELGDIDPEYRDRYLGGVVKSDLKAGEEEFYGTVEDVNERTAKRAAYDVAMDVVESLVLAHAIAGVDVESNDYIEGIEVAVEKS